MNSKSWFSQFNFPNKPLIIADLANNHGGSIETAKKLISQLSELAINFNINICVKFQYRDLETFIYQRYHGTSDYSYIKRFEETKLNWAQFGYLTEYAKSLGLLTAATPFDELSTDFVLAHNHDFLKVASVSSNDWTLISKVEQIDLPILVSTGALTNLETEKIASRLMHKGKDFALMHCVASYPSIAERANILRISNLKKFGVPVGYSTHEQPGELIPSVIAIAAGATIIEKHFGIEEGKISKNKYSLDKLEFSKWLDFLLDNLKYLYDCNFESSLTDQKNTLSQLTRGVRAKKDLEIGEEISIDAVTLSIPVLVNQLVAKDLSVHNKIIAISNINKGDEIMLSEVSINSVDLCLRDIAQQVRLKLQNSNIIMSNNVELEISHHYGLDNFNNFGAVFITLINRDYCKKLIIMKPDQEHPEHYHKTKEETFFILHGDLILNLEGKVYNLLPGSIITINPNMKHSFKSIGGCIFEEISTRHLLDDSFYSDPIISKNTERKSKISFWA